jgi:hypothetical protein
MLYSLRILSFLLSLRTCVVLAEQFGKQHQKEAQQRNAIQAGTVIMTENIMIFTLSTHHAPLNGLGKSPPKRSIFPEYWKQTRLQQEAMAKPPVSPLTPSPPPQDDASKKMYQSPLPLPELPVCATFGDHLPFVEYRSSDIKKHMSNDYRILPRRIIMPNLAYQFLSSPSLSTPRDESFEPKTPPRRIASGSKLEEHAFSTSPSFGSCLRETRFSGCSSRRRSLSVESESSTVRFDMEKVNVIHFEKPQETYSEGGWAEHFP